MEQLQNGMGPAVLYRSHTSVPEAHRKTIAIVHGAFARELTMHLSAYLRATVTIKYVGVEECTFAQFMSARKPCFCAAPIKASPSGSNLILDLEPSLIFAFVEMMLGGKAVARAVPDRPPTEIEKQLLVLVLALITKQLERAWSTVTCTSLQLGGIESNSHLARLLLPTDAVVTARFEASTGEQTGCFTVLTPTHTAETLVEGAESSPAESAEAPDLSRILMDASVAFDVWLDGVSLQLRDLVQLREGHVINFDYPTERNLQSTFNGVAGFPGQVVSTGSKRAFLIQAETVS